MTADPDPAVPSSGDTDPTGSRPLTVAELEQWEAFGASWRPQRFEEGRVIVELCQCTGELVERRPAVDPEVIAYVRAHAGDAA